MVAIGIIYWNTFPAQKKEEIKALILDRYTTLFRDGDHQVVLDDNGILRFKRDPTIDYLNVHYQRLDFNRITIDRLEGGLDGEGYLKLCRGVGYSLGGYEELSCVMELLNALPET